MKCNSLAINREAERRGEEPTFVAADGEGDDTRILWRFVGDGTEVIETNGDPVWDTDEGFRALVSDMSPTGL